MQPKFRGWGNVLTYSADVNDHILCWKKMEIWRDYFGNIISITSNTIAKITSYFGTSAMKSVTLHFGYISNLA